MKSFGKSKNDFANMPQEVMHKKISKTACIGEDYLDDSMDEIDRVVDKSVSTAKKHKSYQK